MNYFIEKTRFKQVFISLLFNILISSIIMFPLLKRAVNDAELPFLPSIIMFLSSATFINVALAIILLFFSFPFVPEKLFKFLCIFFFGFLQAFLIADVKIFSFFKFHINAIVLNFLFTEGASDSLNLGLYTILVYSFILLLIFSFQYFIFRRPLEKIKFPFAYPVFIFLIAIVFIDKITFAYADIKNKTDILAGSRYYPFYFKFTAQKTLNKIFGIKPEQKPDFNIHKPGKSLNYPLKPVNCEGTKKRYNILIMVADGFRYDMWTPEITPNLYKFGSQHIILKNHFSGGNGTRFGIFTLFYGLYGHLWHSFLNARQSPVLLDTLKQLGYDFSILSSTRLSYPEFRSTAFVKLQEYIFDEHKEIFAFKRDALLVDKFKEFIEKRDEQKPFFSFIFFNSSHQFYQYPREFEKFTPVLREEINYMKNLTPEIVEKLKNRYKNSLFYIDSLFKEIIDTLKQKGLLEDTIIVFTGDHGEEFNENGFFSHTSAFDDYQIKTAFIMSIPNKPKQTIEKITSHLDIPATLLSSIGCNDEPSNYSHGNDIFAENRKDYTFSFNWYDGAIVTENYRIIIPLSTEKIRFFEVRRGDNYKTVQDNKIVSQYNEALNTLITGLGRFLK